MSPRICFVVTSPLTAFTFLRGYLAHLAHEGWRVTLISSPHPDLKAFATAEGVELCTVPMRRDPAPLNDVLSLVTMYRTLREVRPDAVVYATPKASLLTALTAALARVSIRVYEQWGLRLEGDHGAKRTMLYAMERLTCALSTDIIANSPSLAARIEDLGLAGQRPIRMLGKGSSHGVDTDAYSPSLEQIPLDDATQEFLSGTEGLTVGFVGRLHPDKGVGALVDALDLCHQRGLSIRGILVGDDEGAVPAARDFSSGAPLHLTGPVADPRPFIQRFDLLVLMSEREGFPNAVLEAAAMGVPAVVANSTGTRDSVVDGDTGIIVPAGDSRRLAGVLTELAADRSRLERMGASARARAVDDFNQHVVRQLHIDYLSSRLVSHPEADDVRPWTFITEAHFACTPDGRVYAMDGSSGDRTWRRYAEQGGPIRVVARTSTTESPVNGDPLTVGTLIPLPDYTGIRGFIREMPRLSRILSRELRASGPFVLRLPGLLSLLAAAIAIPTRRRYAVELVGDIEAVLGSGVGRLPGVVIRAVTALTKSAVRRADAVRYVTRGALQGKYPFRRQAIAVSDVAVPESAFAASARGARDGGPLRVISVGSQQTPYKGHQDIIQAAARLRDEGHSVEVVLVGDGAFQSDLRALADRLGMENRVRFTGALPFAAVMSELRAADVYVQASHTEGLPRALVEAMSQALPVIGTDVGGIPELVPGEFLVPISAPDAIAERLIAMSDEETWHQESARSLEAALRYAPSALDPMFARWCAMIRGLG
ncbi:MAG TPA: glycosyltransferase [Candidatus Brachybacterium merdigallinarum]|nr:glycosyltransferase [Candidatus Brachybacterium merdigallinarum]